MLGKINIDALNLYSSYLLMKEIAITNTTPIINVEPFNLDNMSSDYGDRIIYYPNLLSY